MRRLSLLIGLVALLGAGSPATASDGRWVEIPPPARTEHVAFYDSLGDRLIVIGGRDGGSRRGEIWAFTFTPTPGWAELSVSGAPALRTSGAAAVFDSHRGRILCFGGRTDGSQVPGLRVVVNTLLPLGVAAEVVHDGLGPGGPTWREHASAILDPVRDRVIVFGGNDPGGPRNDVWAMALEAPYAWTQLAPAGGPPDPREGHTAIYDPVRDRMVVYGGRVGGFFPNGEVWTLSLGATPTWALMSPGGESPTPRTNHSAYYDPTTDRMVVTGGYSPGGPLDGTFALDLSGAGQWNGSVLPSSPCFSHASAFDTRRSLGVVFGGYAGAGKVENTVWNVNDLHSPSGYFWSRVYPVLAGPGARYGHTAVADDPHSRMLVFGGLASNGTDPSPLNDTWSFSWNDPPGWTLVNQSNLPARFAHTAVFDPATQLCGPGPLPPPGEPSMLMFGGDEFYGSFLNDLWLFDTDGPPTWTQLSPSGALPSKRVDPAFVYDCRRGRLLLFGGLDEFGVYKNDLWELDLHAPVHWTQLTPTGTPPPGRAAHVAVYDPWRDRMVVYGGEGLSGQLLGDTWFLSFGANDAPGWKPLDPGLAPSPRRGHVAVYDPQRLRMVMYGGDADGVAWTLKLIGDPEWRVFDADGVPPAGRYETSAVLDARNDRMLVYGGLGQETVVALEFKTPPVGVESTVTPAALALSAAWPNPARDVLSIAFALPDGAAASLELLDLAGRRVLRREVGSLGAGRHTVALNTGAVRAPGVYFVRLVRAGESRSTRVCLVR